MKLVNQDNMGLFLLEEAIDTARVAHSKISEYLNSMISRANIELASHHSNKVIVLNNVEFMLSTIYDAALDATTRFQLVHREAITDRADIVIRGRYIFDAEYNIHKLVVDGVIV